MVRALEEETGANSVEVRLRTPPHSLESEQSLLGGLMLDNAAWDKVADIVTAEDFYRKDHAIIFRAIGALAEDRRPADAVTVSEYLDNRGELPSVGGLDYLATLANETPSAANVRAYAEILRERSMLRQLISAGNEIAGSAHRTEGRSASELVGHKEIRLA